ncbi:MAG: hypothetical protein ACP5VF_06475 [Acidobacteriota bacterium]
MKAPLSPLRLYLAGIKITVSNPELPLWQWGAALVLGVGSLAPLAAGAFYLFHPLWASGLRHESPDALLLRVLEVLIPRLPSLFLLAALFLLWVALLCLPYLYVQAGLAGLLASAFLRLPPEGPASSSRLGYSKAFRCFRYAEFREEARRRVWAVSLLASYYSLAGLALAAAVPLAGFALHALLRPNPWATYAGLLGAGALAVAEVPLFVLLKVHARYALACLVLFDLPPGRSVARATRLFRSRPLPVLALFGIGLLLALILAGLFAALDAPIELLSWIPRASLWLVGLRVLLALLQNLGGQGLKVAGLGAAMALCREEAGRPAPGPPRPRGRLPVDSSAAAG